MGLSTLQNLVYAPRFALVRRSRRVPSRKRPPAYKPCLERLEDRTVPSTAWIEQGPGPILNGGNVEGIPGQPEAGAVQALAVDPSNANIVYAGTVNGGVWKTTNATAANPNWAPLTDQKLPALSISSLAISPVNPNVVYAGTGSLSSFRQDGSTGFGLARSNDGGATWNVLAADTFAGQRIFKVVPTTLDAGNVVLADAWLQGIGPIGLSPGGGVYRSTDGGDTFSRISAAAGSGLPDQPVTDLVADPSNPSRFYAAVRLPFNRVPTGNEGVYRTDNGGLTWTAVNTGLTGLGTARRIVLAVHNSPGHDVVYVMVNSVAADLQGVFRSSDGGASWTSMGLPATDPFGAQQGNFQGAIVADPTDPNVVFLSGDGVGSNSFSSVKTAIEEGTVVRGDASLKKIWTNVYDTGANGTAPHPDSRAMVFDANGNLLEACDGGIYRLVNPDTPATRVWVSVNGNLGITEFHSVAYDPVSNVVFGGTQDNGAPVQAAPGASVWNEPSPQPLLTGDGGVVAVDSDQAAHPGTSIRYSSIQFFFGFNRRTVDANNVAGDPVFIKLKIVSGDGKGKDLFHFDPNIEFYQPFVLNAIDPRRMLIGTKNLYESLDQGDSLADLGFTGDVVGALTNAFGTYEADLGRPMAYGGRLNGVANADVFYVGSGAKVLHRIHLGDSITTLNAYPGADVISIAVDPQNYQRVYVVDQNNRVWASFDEGASWSELTANLHDLTPDEVGRTIEIFSPQPGTKDDVLIVGALGGVFEMVRPDRPGAHWTVLGDGLPHALTLDLHYDYTDNVLLAGTLGRGAWTLSNPFGLADAPAATASTSIRLMGPGPGAGVLQAGDSFLAALGSSTRSSASGAGVLRIGDLLAAAAASLRPSPGQSMISAPATVTQPGTAAPRFDPPALDPFFAGTRHEERSVTWTPAGQGVQGATEDEWMDVLQTNDAPLEGLKPALPER